MIMELQPIERKLIPIEQRERRAWAQLKQMEADFLHLEERMRAEVQRTKHHEQLLRQHQTQYRESEQQYQELERRYQKEYVLKQQVKEVVREVEVVVPASQKREEIVTQRVQSTQRVVFFFAPPNFVC